MNLNKVMLIGNLTRDPELKYTPSGTAVATFGIAVNRKYKQGDEWKEEVCFVDITVWSRAAENCAEYLKKGSAAFIEGRLRFSSWESDGKKRSKLEVVADSVQFMPKNKPEGQQQGNYNNNNSNTGSEKSESYSNEPTYNDEPPF
ncbi:MAG: single-stranded DNA-binding protein [Nitrospinae bacterium]|nr:single-stranded DNA-binding protein [Nitrospinota bacterium]